MVEHGHDIILEAGAGEGSFFTDLQFSEAGAQITTSQAEVYGQDLVLKINPPTEEEMEFLKPNAYLVSALQINLRDKAYFKKLAEKRLMPSLLNSLWMNTASCHLSDSLAKSQVEFPFYMHQNYWRNLMA